MPTVLVTGSAGFIGFHVCQRLLKDGYDVVGYDSMSNYYDPALKQARLQLLQQSPRFSAVTAPLEDYAVLEKTVVDAKPDYVIHLAAQAGVRYSLENPRSYVDSNLIGSFNLLEIVRHHPVQHLLIASTSSVYGANEKIPFVEVDRTDEPLTLYAATKKSMELMSHSYSHLFRIPVTTFRFFTVYGPWGRPDMAAFKFVSAILNGKPIDIYGQGKMSRDFTYIDDLVESIVRLMKVIPGTEPVMEKDTLARQAPFRVVNIGGGQPESLMDFVELIESALGQKAIRNMLPMQSGDVPRTYANPDLLVALTGYKPQTNLATGIEAFVKWYREYHKI